MSRPSSFAEFSATPGAVYASLATSPPLTTERMGRLNAVAKS